jgi:hypothetical protein
MTSPVDGFRWSDQFLFHLEQKSVVRRYRFLFQVEQEFVSE